ncbi:putative pre-mRNA-processing protein 40A-like isoform X2 [Capsicum annuum]|nr:putative pre-mRNA-processing protein 40A-like isoform X2 [Capsicum annuum]
MDIKQLQADQAATVRGDILKCEVQNELDALSYATPKLKYLELQVSRQCAKKDENINQLTNDLQECMKELGIVKYLVRIGATIFFSSLRALHLGLLYVGSLVVLLVYSILYGLTAKESNWLGPTTSAAVIILDTGLEFQENLSDPRITSVLKWKERHTDHELANLLQDKGLDPNFVAMLKENGLGPIILALLQRSSLDADREHRDNNPPVTDSNDIEDALPNHISFSKELRLQGLGKWLQLCRVGLIEIRVKALEGVHSDYGDTYEDPKLKPPIPPLAGPAPGAIPSMSLQVTGRPVVGMHSMPQGPPIPYDFQRNLPMSSNHMPGSGGPNLPLSSSYNVNADSSGSQYQTQINDDRFPSGVQPWMPISNHNVNSATTMQKTGELAAPLVVPGTDASTDFREFTSPEGRKYYYNKVTRTSKWRMSDEVKLAREKDTISHASDFGSISVVKTSSSGADGSLVSTHGAKSSLTVVSPAANLPTIVASESSSLSGKVSSSMIEIVEMKNSSEPASPAVANSEKIGIAVTLGNSIVPPVSENTTTQDTVVYGDGFSSENRENVKKDAAITEIGGATPSDEKTVELGPLVYESKAKAKSAFKTLLESANIGSDCTWDQAMRAVINDRRYGVLKCLCERKQAFNKYLCQKKKLEAEARRVKQKKARKDFKIMLEDCKELSPSSRWSKAISIFKHDEHFKAVKRAKDREDLFEDYVEELEKMVKLLLQNFLASSQWRKVQDRLETDERCSHLEKIDRLEIFQIKDFAAYVAVSSNTIGSTANGLFTDVMDELEKQVK